MLKKGTILSKEVTKLKLYILDDGKFFKLSKSNRALVYMKCDRFSVPIKTRFTETPCMDIRNGKVQNFPDDRNIIVCYPDEVDTKHNIIFKSEEDE